MRNLPDYHLHTNATEDGHAGIEEIVRTAAEKGIPEVLINDHYILGLAPYCVTPEVLENHFAAAEKLRAETGVIVRIGMEIDYFEGREAEIDKMISMFDFDMVLGAAHFVDGWGVASEPHTHELFARFDPATCYRKSLDLLAKAVRTGLFDVMAHLDIIRKFSIKKFGAVPFDEYGESAEAVVAAMLETGTGFEINCRGFEHEPEEQYPGREFLTLLKERGVETVTIGSDAHTLDCIGTFLNRGARALAAAGFNHICTFEKRTPTNIPLSEFSL